MSAIETGGNGEPQGVLERMFARISEIELHTVQQVGTITAELRVGFAAIEGELRALTRRVDIANGRTEKNEFAIEQMRTQWADELARENALRARIAGRTDLVRWAVRLLRAVTDSRQLVGLSVGALAVIAGERWL